MNPKLTSIMLASALMRRVQMEGGNAAVLKKGDETSGVILILSREKGSFSGIWERLLMSEGCYQWIKVGPQDIDNEGDLNPYIERRMNRDPDLWLVELDIVNAERFIVDSASKA